MGRRVLAFFLGFLIGIIFIVGGVAGAIAIAVKVVKVEQYTPAARDYIGDLAGFSIYDIGDQIYKLYQEKIGKTDENGNYYTLGEFCAKYNIDLSKAFGGAEVPQEVRDIPAFEFFGENGMDNAMKQIKVSTLPAIADLFSNKNEDGTSNGMFGDDVMTELANYSMYDLLSNEEVGIAGVFANIRIAQLLPDSFPAEDSDNKLMWAVGQTKIGGLLNGISGSESIMLQLKEGGAFEALGGLQLTAILGESQYVNAILGSDAVFADLIADDGTIRFDDIINGVSVGELLGCQKNEITVLDDYAAIDGQSPDAETQVMQKGEGESIVYVMSSNGENWFETELKCENTAEGHVHNAECFKYVWYSTEICNNDHTHENSNDMLKDGNYYPRTDGLYAVLAALSITDLTSGNTDALMDEIKKVKIGDIIDAAEVDGIMSAFMDLTIEELMNGAIDDMYLGEFFSLHRVAIQSLSDFDLENAVTVYKKNDTEVIAYYVAFDASGNVAMSTNQKDWYEGKLDCDNDEGGHAHDENCYSYLWLDKDEQPAEGIQNKLASKQIADLQNLNDEVLELTLLDVFGADNVPSMLKSIENVKIGELNTAVNTLQLGTLLEYSGGLTCEITEENHTHDYTCYSWTDKEGKPVTGMMAKLACKQVSEMSDLTTTIKTFTLRDVLGDSIPDMLKSLADTEIGDLDGAIKEMRLGDFLEYEKRYVCADKDVEGHTHDASCEYVWYQLKCENAEGDHVHDDGCYAEVVGMMAKLADKRVDELNNLDSLVQDFTLRDVLGDNLPVMLEDVADRPISNVSEAIEEIYLGSALSYQRKEITDVSEYTVVIGDIQSDGDYLVRRHQVMTPAKYIKREAGQKTWYEAVKTCTSKEHDNSDSHTIDCYGYVWYEKDGATPVDGMMKAFVNTRVGDVDGRMQTLTLGDMGLGGDNSILRALQDTPIQGIGAAVNGIKMAVVLGYEKHYTCADKNVSGHEHTDDCSYIWIAECTSTHENPTDHLRSDHLTNIKNDGKNYYQPRGLNARIAEKTVGEMTGDTLTDIALNLTIGELMDCGMITLGDNAEETSYKLSLLFSEEHHSFKENVFLGNQSQGEKTFSCTLADYAQYKMYYGKQNVTTKQYWELCHGKLTQDGVTSNYTGTDDEYKAHTEAWKNMTLKAFVSELLNAF